MSVTGLGTLRNKIGSDSAVNATVARVEGASSIPLTNIAKTINGTGLTTVNNKKLFYRHLGPESGPPVVFVHGLGGTNDYWTPLITALDLASTHSCHLFDFEGHGLSATSPLSTITIASLAEDIKGIFSHASITSGATLVAHSMGCLVALSFAISNPNLLTKLILVGPPPNPLPEAGSKGSHARAALVRTQGLAAVVDAVVTAGTSDKTKKSNPLAVAAVRMSLLGQDPESYAKACTALAGATEEFDVGKVEAEVLIVTGSEDKVSPPGVCEAYKGRLGKCRDPVVLDGVGHWHVFEDVDGVAGAVKAFL